MDGRFGWHWKDWRCDGVVEGEAKIKDGTHVTGNARVGGKTETRGGIINGS